MKKKKDISVEKVKVISRLYIYIYIYIFKFYWNDVPNAVYQASGPLTLRFGEEDS